MGDSAGAALQPGETTRGHNSAGGGSHAYSFPPGSLPRWHNHHRRRRSPVQLESEHRIGRKRGLRAGDSPHPRELSSSRPPAPVSISGSDDVECSQPDRLGGTQYAHPEATGAMTRRGASPGAGSWACFQQATEDRAWFARRRQYDARAAWPKKRANGRSLGSFLPVPCTSAT